MTEPASRDLQTKLTQLRITKSKTETKYSSGSVTRIKIHKDSLHAVVAAVEKSKRKEELEIASGEECAYSSANRFSKKIKKTKMHRGLKVMLTWPLKLKR